MTKQKEPNWEKILVKKIPVETLTLRMDEDLLKDLKKIQKNIKCDFQYVFNYMLRLGLDFALDKGDNYKVPILKKQKKRISVGVKLDLLKYVRELHKGTGYSRGILINFMIRTGFEEALKLISEESNK